LGKRSKKKIDTWEEVRETEIECRILVRKPQGSKSRGKYRPRQENVKIGLKREICCWGGLGRQ
jgi:hypothetical protein